MNGIINFFIACILKYNILFLGLLIILQGLAVPTCPSIVVIALGALGYSGYFNPIALYFEVWILVTLGDAVSYYIWKTFQGLIFGKFPRFHKKIEKKLKKAKYFLNKRGRWAVFLSRFVVSAMAPVINIAAGITEYNFKEFIITAAIGDLFWTLMYEGIGFWFGDSWEQAASVVTEFSKLIGLIVIFIIALLICKKRIFNKRNKKLKMKNELNN